VFSYRAVCVHRPGYVTATLATFFLDLDADNEDAEVAGQRSIALLQRRFDLCDLKWAS
jgi:hypothetical protein